MMKRLAFALLAFFPALVLGSAVRAAPPEHVDPTLAPWFQSLQRPDVGGSCCSASDCRRVQSRIDERRYEVLLDGIWIPVPPEKILHRENPTSEAVVCARSHIIFCFVPPPGV